MIAKKIRKSVSVLGTFIGNFACKDTTNVVRVTKKDKKIKTCFAMKCKNSHEIRKDFVANLDQAVNLFRKGNMRWMGRAVRHPWRLDFFAHPVITDPFVSYTADSIVI